MTFVTLVTMVTIHLLSAGDLEVTIVGSGGSKIPVDLDKDGLKYTVSYVPDKIGSVLVSVKFAGNEVRTLTYVGSRLYAPFRKPSSSFQLPETVSALSDCATEGYERGLRK